MYRRCYMYIKINERITMPTQTALRMRGGEAAAASSQLAEKV